MRQVELGRAGAALVDVPADQPVAAQRGIVVPLRGPEDPLAVIGDEQAQEGFGEIGAGRQRDLDPELLPVAFDVEANPLTRSHVPPAGW